jgi:hypothetical protein
MRRNPRLINLKDKPLYPRPRLAPRRDDSAGYGAPLLSCLAIVLVTGGFFWLYGAIAYREPPYMPAVMASPAVPGYPVTASRPLPPPDMSSLAAALAHADAHAPTEAARQEPVKTAEQPRKKKPVHIVKRIPQEAAQAFASHIPDRAYGGY